MRFHGMAYLGRVYGRQVISVFSRHYRTMLNLLIALAVAASIGALIYFKPAENFRFAQFWDGARWPHWAPGRAGRLGRGNVGWHFRR